MTESQEILSQEKENTSPQAPSQAPLSREQMLADTDQLLAEFALDYKRMSE